MGHADEKESVLLSYSTVCPYRHDYAILMSKLTGLDVTIKKFLLDEAVKDEFNCDLNSTTHTRRLSMGGRQLAHAKLSCACYDECSAAYQFGLNLSSHSVLIQKLRETIEPLCTTLI